MLFFYLIILTLSCDFRVHRAGSQLKSIAIFGYKQRLLSLDMKTKIVQHVSRINLSHFKFWILNLNFQIFNFFLVPSFCLTTETGNNRLSSIYLRFLGFGQTVVDE